MVRGRLSVRRTTLSIITTLGLVAGMFAGTVFTAGSALAASASIVSAGPLTRVEISDDLNCAVDYLGDSEPEFYGDTACATLVAAGGTLYGPAYIPAGGGAAPRTTYTLVSQSAVTGAGTSGNPYKIITVVDLGTSGLRITQTDTYVVGEEVYRTDVRVANQGNSAATAILYRAGDCYLQNSDNGFGAADPITGSVSCVAGVAEPSARVVPGTRIEQWYPLSPGSHYYEDYYSSVWSMIGSQLPFADSCTQCANYVDNGAGLSWNLSIPAGQSVTRSNLTVFSPLGLVPLTTTKTADSSTADPGGSDGYTITVHNPNAGSVSLSAITDTLPAGFSYTPGSTTGATTADPSIAGQDLRWDGPISVPGAGEVSIHFNVTVSSETGDYYNNAGAEAARFSVAPTGDTALITVGQAPPPGCSSQPDALIRGGPADSHFLGNDIYNTTGAHQTKVRIVRRGYSDSFTVKLENDGLMTDGERVDGECTDVYSVGSYPNVRSPRITIHYWSGDTNVTHAVKAGTFMTGPLGPGESESLMIRVYVNPWVNDRPYQKKVLITATSEADPMLMDTVGAKVVVDTGAGDSGGERPVT